MRITEADMPQVATNRLDGGLLSVRANPSEMGGDIGTALQSLGQDTAQISEKIDSIHAQQIANHIDQQSSLRIAQAEQLKGQEGINSAEALPRDLDSIREQAYKDFSANDRVRARVDLATSHDSTQRLLTAGRIYQSKTLEWANETNQTTVDTARQTVSEDFTKLPTAIDDTNLAIMKMAKDNGWPPEKAALMQQQARSNIYSDVVNSFISKGDYEGADAFFNAQDEKGNSIKNDMDPRVHTQLEAAIRHGLMYQQVDKATELAMAAAQQKGISAGMDMIDKTVKDPEVRNKAAGQLQLRWNMAKQDENKAQEDTQRDLVVSVYKNGDLSDEEKSRLYKLDPGRIENVMSLIKQEQGGENIKTQPSAYINLRSGIANGDFTSEDQILAYADKVSRGDLDHALKDWQNKDHVDQSAVMTAYKNSNRIGKNKGLSASNMEDFTAFSDWANKNVKENHRPEDIQALADQWVMEGKPAGATSVFGFHRGPGTFGQAIRAGLDADGFELSSTDNEKAVVESAAKMSGVQTKDINTFNTQYAVPAKRWLAAHPDLSKGQNGGAYDYSPENIALYASVSSVVGKHPTTTDFSDGAQLKSYNIPVTRLSMRAVQLLRANNKVVNQQTISATAKILENASKAQSQ